MVERRDPVAVALAVDRGNASTSTPMLLAVPAMIRAAISTSFALRSAIFFWAMSRTCAWVSTATLSRLGTPEPFSIPAACLISSAAGGCLRMNENVRSSKIVRTAGITCPAIACVCSLYCLQKSMMLTPC